VKYPFHTPLIIFTPKSLLRHPECISDLKTLAEGRFQPVVDDDKALAEKVKRIIFCSGKVYYDLNAYKTEKKQNDVAIVRIELLYPFPEKEIKEIIKKYNLAKNILWIQEEPENYGAWPFFKNWFNISELNGVFRKAGAAPATGFHKQHAIEQQEIVEKAFFD